MLRDYIVELEKSELISVTPKNTNKQIRLIFSKEPPKKESGVYVNCDSFYKRFADETID
jgi:hypothetical protein